MSSSSQTAFYAWQPEDLTSAVHCEIFKSGLDLLLHLALPAPEDQEFLDVWFREDMHDTIRRVSDAPLSSKHCCLYEGISLPMLSIAENPRLCLSGFFIEEIQNEYDDRTRLCATAEDPTSIGRWTYPHHCELQALFVTYPLVRLLYPHMPLYICANGMHIALTNSDGSQMDKTQDWTGQKQHSREVTKDIIVFDPISSTADSDLAFPLSTEHGELRIVPEHAMAAWYIEQYGYTGMAEQPIIDFCRSVRELRK